MVNKLLKLLIIVILVLIVVTFTITCINIIKKNKNTFEILYEFSGVVDETTATSIIVIPDEDEEILRSSDRIQIGTKGVIYEKGDRVTVMYKEGIAETYPAKVDVISIIKEDYSKAVKLYITVIDAIMNEDRGLNENIEYLAIDTDSFMYAMKGKNGSTDYQVIKDDDKSKILNYCSKYSTDIRKNSLEELKEQDLFNNQTMSLNGMVIYVEKIYELSLTEAKFEIVKYVSGDGALFGTYTLKYINSMWKITDVDYAIS